MFNGSVNNTSAVFCMAYFVTAQNRVHPLCKTPADAFRRPYDRTAESLFDGLHEDEDIVKDEDIVRALPSTLKDLFTPEFYARIKQPAGAFKDVLRANDGTCDWKPAVPVHLFSASGDTDVPIANARNCAGRLAAHGTHAPVTDQGAVDHNRTFMKSAPQTVSFFDRVAGRD